MSLKTEAALQRYLFKCAKAHGMYIRKMQASGRRGFPDCLVIGNEQPYFIELKSPAGTGRLSELQKREIAHLRKHGQEVRVVATVTEVDRVIREIIERKATGGG